jgi:hypothetical protein
MTLPLIAASETGACEFMSSPSPDMRGMSGIFMLYALLMPLPLDHAQLNM